MVEKKILIDDVKSPNISKNTNDNNNIGNVQFEVRILTSSITVETSVQSIKLFLLNNTLLSFQIWVNGENFPHNQFINAIHILFYN